VVKTIAAFLSQRRRDFSVTGLLLLGLLLLGGCATPAPRIALDLIPAAQNARAEHNLRLYRTVWSLAADKFYDPQLNGADWPAAGKKFGALAAAAPDDRTLYATLNEMLALLNDRHTFAATPLQTDAKRVQQSALTGLTLARIEGRWVVTEVLPGSPAEEAGVRPGWLVVARNGEPLGERALAPLREGEIVRWEFLDPQDRPVALALTARPVSTKPNPISRALPGGFVYLRFDSFDPANRRWLSAQLKAHRDAPGVVIDLRRNHGGGSFSLATSVGEFFDRSMACGTFVTRGGYRYDTSTWQPGSAHYTGQVVVLVDGASASAAEIFSAVLQEHGRATVVGRTTAGAVIGADFYALPDGGELELGRYDYFTPKGRRLEGRGIEPDVKVSPTLADLRAGRDADLEAALEKLNASR
jgi:carboxyl-terminal processing protease